MAQPAEAKDGRRQTDEVVKKRKILLAGEDWIYLQAIAPQVEGHIPQTGTIMFAVSREHAEKLLRTIPFDFVITTNALYPTKKHARAHFLGNDGFTEGVKLIENLRSNKDWKTPADTSIIVLNTAHLFRLEERHPNFSNLPGVRIIDIAVAEQKEFLEAFRQDLTNSSTPPTT